MTEKDAESVEWIRQVMDARPNPARLPRLTLRQYRETVGRRIPTRRQIQDFVTYVTSAKSWYKHLPLWPPGVPFYFFIDPWAGLNRFVMPNGKVMHLRRMDDPPRFHYSWISTDEYRTRFGQLTFATRSGTDLFFPITIEVPPDSTELRGILDGNWSRITLNVGEGGEFQLPQELLDAGRVDVTGVIHPLAANCWAWVLGTADGPPPGLVAAPRRCSRTRSDCAVQGSPPSAADQSVGRRCNDCPQS